MERVTRDDLVAYLDGQLTRDQIRAVEQQLAHDSRAQRQLEDLRGLAKSLTVALEPAGSGRLTTQVVARLDDAPVRSRWLWGVAAVASLSAVTTLALVLAPSVIPPGELTARGSAGTTLSRQVGVEVYVHLRSDPFTRRKVDAGQRVSASDGFTFVTTNRSQRIMHMVLLALDAADQIHWLYPDGGNDLAQATSIPVASAPQRAALAEGVTLGSAPPGTLRIIAVFTPAPTALETIRALVASGGAPALSAGLPGAAVQVSNLTVAEVTP